MASWLTVDAALLAGWSATAFVDSSLPLVAGAASLVPLVSVLALPVIAIGVAGRHVVPTAVAVLAALLPWSLVTEYAVAGPGQHDAGNSPTLRVMSVDGAGGRADPKDVVQATRLYSVDVVVITGLTSELVHDLTVAGLGSLAPARWVSEPTGNRLVGVWARPEVTDLTPLTGMSRPGVDGTIRAGSSRVGLRVVQLAGDPLRPGANWHADLARVASLPAPTPHTLIVGDLNASPWQPAFRRLTGSGWHDAADVVGRGLRPTWPSWSPLPISPIDHALVSTGLGVTGADVTPIDGSTHRALIVTLVPPASGG